ncbi:hypothetical protein B0J11DRAFT_613812 [Dendryphion nanum]|uniref:Uncharacterized protein n=1 Tax=Dendryphion nanum TaxID=256645 RepID=A0A9P9E0T2_9PLEO|nr:hypothetical protein B0J11DRAFT_613812 [Dendryphion nanum]
MKLILLLTILTGLALAFPWPSSTNVKRGKTCDDCKKRYDNCNTLVRTQNTWCEQICRKYTCKLDRICEECNNGFYNCTALLRVPTIPINESEEHTPPTKNKRYESVNLPTFVAPVADEVPQGLKTDLCPESFTCDKEGETHKLIVTDNHFTIAQFKNQ